MKYSVLVSCISHVGLHRKNNQDNFVCDHQFMHEEWKAEAFPLNCAVQVRKPCIIGLFDGMGGEECGEIASRIAAETASEYSIKNPEDDLRDLCLVANQRICQYATSNGIGSMGTTAAMLVFDKQDITLCNIGDSKILRCSEEGLEQISVDHIVPIDYGTKPPLSQNLGIPPEEMMIEPYISKGYYRDGDLYILCSDGLTDMITPDEMIQIIANSNDQNLTRNLVNCALKNGGRDNVTIITCRIVRETGKLFKMFGNK